MFTELFNNKQKRIFLKIAEEVLTSDDGKIDEMEKKHLLQLCNEMRLLPKDKKDFDMENLHQVFPEQETRKALLLECIFLACSNEVFHSHQKEYIINISKILSLTNSDVEFMSREIEKMIKIQCNFLDFVFSGGN